MRDRPLSHYASPGGRLPHRCTGFLYVLTVPFAHFVLLHLRNDISKGREPCLAPTEVSLTWPTGQRVVPGSIDVQPPAKAIATRTHMPPTERGMS